jgi:ketosteroid isomerase-like protein
MSTANETLVRTAYAAYEQGDVTALLDTVDPDLEWTYLDPSEANPNRRSATVEASWKVPCSGSSGGV